MSKILVWIIKLYQKISRVLSPFPTCRFSPSCSEFATHALIKHGVFRGLIMSFWRLLRCQGFSRGGFDPVK
ncbi:MAG: membrane protein insertion efficiency factor YidD [Candidatus Omnitrophica bacterium]|nr:membrane protein insertion efficiency factor YidD [Candidatus Omnitrophota bacterium]